MWKIGLTENEVKRFVLLNPTCSLLVKVPVRPVHEAHITAQAREMTEYAGQ